MASHTLLDEDQPVPQAWFDAQVDRSQGKPHQQAALATLKSFHDEYVKILKSYHDGQLTAGEAANRIIRPISTSPVPELGGYSDNAIPLCRLWALLITALIQWPSSRTGDLVSLLTAISKVPDNIHRGEVLDDTVDDADKPLTWRSLPWFKMVWSDGHWKQPGMITRRASDEATRHRERDIYIKREDVAAQLVAAGLFQWKLAYQYLINALERKPNAQDRVEAANDGEADGQLKMDFHIPAATRWIEHNGKKLYEGLVKDELRDWNARDIPSIAIQFERSIDRWVFWRDRFAEIQKEETDEFTTQAAGVAVGLMEEFQQ